MSKNELMKWLTTQIEKGYNLQYNFFRVRAFKRLDKANRSIEERLKRRANGKISQATKKIPAILVESERERLRLVRKSIFRKVSPFEREERNVNEKDCISVNACGNQLPLRKPKNTG